MLKKSIFAASWILAYFLAGVPWTFGGVEVRSLNFERVTDDRRLIDRYQDRHWNVSAGVEQAPIHLHPARPKVEGFLRTVYAPHDTATLASRKGASNGVVPLPGFRAPILDDSARTMLLGGSPLRIGGAEAATVEIIRRRLALDGLLITLLSVVEQLGPSVCLADVEGTLHRLERHGFPIDLLRHFDTGDDWPSANRARGILTSISEKLTRGVPAKVVAEELRSFRFDYIPSWSEGSSSASNLPVTAKFSAASESGDEALGMVRLQVGGGWSGGIVPGGSLDVVHQIADAYRGLDFLVSVNEKVASSFESQATFAWRMSRLKQVALCIEETPVTAWAQDNGKAGVIKLSNGVSHWATLTPRFASTGAANSVFEPGESFLMDGLRAAGHTVIHTSLLFQGGNLLVAQLPKTSARLLLIGEGEVVRNTALGLKGEQVLEAFRREFGVERCVVVPAVSYHLDFDVCLRTHGNDLVAFVNDIPAASRRIVGLGIDALEHHELIAGPAAVALRGELASGKIRELLSRLTGPIPALNGSGGVLSSNLSRSFVADPMDSASGNLQVFLLALDLLESELDIDSPKDDSSERAAYLMALRRMSQASLSQAAELKRLGFQIATLASMPDLGHGINYLNGVHHRDGYIMPIYGGHYAPLDADASAAFRKVLGTNCTVVSVRTAECQRKHGAVHCAVAAFPKLELQR